MSLLHSLGLLGLAVAPAAAFWRLPCKTPIVVERADPIVAPGKVSNHLHTIMGGNGFDYVMDYNSTQASTCSSCTVIGDNSNYWTPTVWYQAEDGSFEEVDQLGGATIYYLQRGGKDEKLKAFPPGFRMIAGDPFKRTPGDDFASQAISYACLNYDGPAKPETPGFPNYNCPNGIRAQVFFPSCWNGKDLDVPDHKAHMSYPVDAYNSGSCPPDFPVHLVSLFFEIIWDTGKFANRWYGGKQPFVFSMGDPTGYGGHGDFVMGWEEEHLQRAVDTCTADSGRVEDCPEFKLIPDFQAEGCTIPPRVNELTTGKLSKLPGCNPVQLGPNRAEVKTDCDATTELGQGNATFFKDLTSSGWSYVGCGTDNYFNRILNSANTAKDDMTNEKCVAFCESKGFSVAGTEYSKECYCGNSIPDSGAPVPGVPGNCKMPCAGDGSQTCGGSGPITLYQKCSGDKCENASFGVKPPSGVVVPSGGYGGASSAVSSAAASTSAAASSSSAMMMNPAPSSAASSSSSAADSTTTTGESYPPTYVPSSGSPSTATDLPSGWTYKGCYFDTLTPRSLPTWSDFNGASMSNARCIAFCEAKGFSVAGTEYAGQCFCGNEITSDVKDDGECSSECTGSDGEACGGAALLSVYSKEMKKRSSVVRAEVRRHLDEHLHARKHVSGGIRH